MPPVQGCDTAVAQCSETKGVPSGYVHIHTDLPNDQVFKLDEYDKDHMHNRGCITDLLTDNGISTA
jgi:hypothetical protein